MAEVERELRVWADRQVKAAPSKAARAAAGHATSTVPRTVALSEALFDALDRAVRCRRCGRTLRTARSKARGIGPECLTLEEAA